MSVRMALAKLCACTCGGAIIGGGAVHVAENARPATVYSTKSVKAKPRQRVLATAKRPPAKKPDPIRVTVTTPSPPIPLPPPPVQADRKSVV